MPDLHCPNCGYNVTGLPGKTCPECGYVFSTNETHTMKPWPSPFVLISMFGWPVALMATMWSIMSRSVSIADVPTFMWGILGVVVLLNAAGMASHLVRTRLPSRKQPALLAGLTAVRIVVWVILLTVILVPAILLGMCLMMFR